MRQFSDFSLQATVSYRNLSSWQVKYRYSTMHTINFIEIEQILVPFMPVSKFPAKNQVAEFSGSDEFSPWKHSLDEKTSGQN